MRSMPTEELIIIDGPIVKGTALLQEYHPDFVPQFINLFQPYAEPRIALVEHVSREFAPSYYDVYSLGNGDVFSRLDEVIANIGKPGLRARSTSILELARQVIGNQTQATHHDEWQTRSLAEDLARFTD